MIQRDKRILPAFLNINEQMTLRIKVEDILRLNSDSLMSFNGIIIMCVLGTRKHSASVALPASQNSHSSKSSSKSSKDDQNMQKKGIGADGKKKNKEDCSKFNHTKWVDLAILLIHLLLFRWFCHPFKQLFSERKREKVSMYQKVWHVSFISHQKYEAHLHICTK